MQHRFQLLPIVLVLLMTASVVAEAQQDSPSGIEVYSNLPNARVYVDEQYVGETESRFGSELLRVSLDPGTYRVRVVVEDYAPNTTQVTVSEDAYRRHEVRFEQSDRRVRTGEGSTQRARRLTGTITVKTIPLGATVVLDGQRLGSTRETDLVVEDENVGPKHIEVFFDRDDPDQYLDLVFELQEDDTVTVTADFYEGQIYPDIEYPVSFNSEADGATVAVGEERYQLPATLSVPHGTLEYRVEAPGYEAVERTTDIRGSRFINETLDPLRRRIIVETEPPGATVHVDGRSVGTSPEQFSTRDRSFDLELRPPERYPRLRTERRQVRAEANQTEVRISHSFKARPSATLRFSFNGDSTNIRATAEGGEDEYELLGTDTQVTQVESGQTTILLYEDTESIASFTAEFQSGGEYTAYVSLPAPAEEVLRSAESLSDYRAPVPEPDYLPESRTERVRDGRSVKTGGSDFEQTMYVLGPLLGGFLGGSCIVHGISGDEQFSGGATIGGLAGIAIGGVVTYLIGTEPSYDTRDVRLFGNMEINSRRRRDWKEENRQRDAHNQQLLEAHNAEVRARNERRAEAGEFDLEVRLVETNTGAEIPAEVEQAR